MIALMIRSIFTHTSTMLVPLARASTALAVGRR